MPNPFPAFDPPSLIWALPIAALLILARLLAKRWRQAPPVAALPGRLRFRIQGLAHQWQANRLARRRLGLQGPLAYSRHWSAAPDFLALIVEHVLAEKPATIVECGSGASTVLLARCCQLNGRGRVVSLEHGAEFAAATRAELARHCLEDQATVIDAPLVSLDLGGHTQVWYDPAGLTAQDIDMLVIDGPPGHVRRHARYPALPVLAGRLAGGCTVFLDDAARPDERDTVRRWQAELPGLACRYLGNDRGCAVLVLPVDRDVPVADR